MTIDEAIKHCEEIGLGCDKCADEHKQLAEWLKELKESENLIHYISKERNKIDFYYNGKEVSWNEIPLEVRKHDYPCYFRDNLDCYPCLVK